MSGGPELSSNEWGWIVAIAASTWGIVLRYVIGHYVKVGERLDARLAAIEARLTGVESRLTTIEARSYHRRKED